VDEFPGNSYKGYKIEEKVEARYKKHLRKKNRMKTFFFTPIFLIMIADLLYMIVV
jgi:hypothetical protein